VPSFFIAGIIQGSKPHGIHGQDYRGRIRSALSAAFPGDEVFCPFENHPESIAYDDAEARRTLFALFDKCSACDVTVAYVPEASMGTAIEMWRAFDAGKLVVAISGMTKNWIVKFCSHHVCTDLDDFEAFVRHGGLAALIEQRRREP